MGITAGSREVPGRNACDRRNTYCIMIIIIIIIIPSKRMFLNLQRAVPVPEEPSASRRTDVLDIILSIKSSQKSRQ